MFEQYTVISASNSFGRCGARSRLLSQTSAQRSLGLHQHETEANVCGVSAPEAYFVAGFTWIDGALKQGFSPIGTRSPSRSPHDALVQTGVQVVIIACSGYCGSVASHQGLQLAIDKDSD